MFILIQWLINAIAILIAAYFLPGIHVENFLTALIVALVLGILNTIVKPILFLLTLPITIITLGLFTFILNACIVLLAAFFVKGFIVDGFWWALLFSIVMSLMNGFIGKIAK